MSTKSKKSTKKSKVDASDASSKPTKKSTNKKSTKKVVPIVDALKVDCPKCKVHKGHRCVHTNSNKGEKRDNPHRARVQRALKLAPKKAA